MKTIFLSFTMTNSSLTEYFLVFANKLTDDYRVVVITDNIQPHPFEVSPKLEIFQWPSKRPTTWKSFLFLLKKILKYRPETMVSMFGSMNVFVIAGFLLRVKNRVAWNRSIYAKTAESKKRDNRKKWIYRLATHVFANSYATQRDLEEHFDVPPEKITMVYNAVSKANLKNTNPDRNTFLYLGRLHPAKGLDTLLMAMPKVLAVCPEARLKVVAGFLDGNAIKQYQAMASDLNITTAVEFTGQRPKQEAIATFPEVSFCVVPSLLEAFGFVVIESFSTATPVVGSDTTGIAEIVRDGKDGLTFEPGNPDDLAEKIITMLTDQDFRDRCSASCYQRFLDTFEIGKVTDGLCDIVKKLR